MFPRQTTNKIYESEEGEQDVGLIDFLGIFAVDERACSDAVPPWGQMTPNKARDGVWSKVCQLERIARGSFGQAGCYMPT